MNYNAHQMFDQKKQNLNTETDRPMTGLDGTNYFTSDPVLDRNCKTLEIQYQILLKICKLHLHHNSSNTEK